MAGKRWLLFDCNYMCYRAMFTRGKLVNNDEPVGVIYGFLGDVAFLMDEFKTSNVAFAWDYGRGKRLEIFPGYKGTRRIDQLTEEEQQLRDAMKVQVAKLRDKYLRQLGFRNVYREEGYEADDILASLAVNHPDNNDELIIVTADKDLFQVIRENVWVYNPKMKKKFDLEWFRDVWKMEPPMFAYVKAAAGCETDCVPGIVRVGETYAARWVRNELPHHTVPYQRITSTEGVEIINRNLQLVRLPLEGCPVCTLQPCTGPIRERWNSLADHFDMPTLKQVFPGEPRGIRGVRPIRTTKGFRILQDENTSDRPSD